MEAPPKKHEFDFTFPIICEIIDNHEGWINSDEIARLLRQNPLTEKPIQKRIEKSIEKGNEPLDEIEATVNMVAFFIYYLEYSSFRLYGGYLKSC